MAFFAYNQRQPPQNHPFWAFVNTMNEQAEGEGRPPFASRDRAEQTEASQARPEQNSNTSPNGATYRAPSVEDEKMNDAAPRPAKRDLADNVKQSEKKEAEKEKGGEGSGSSDEEMNWGWGYPGGFGRRGGRHGPHRGHPFGQFASFCGPDFAAADFSDWTPRGGRGGGPRGGAWGHPHHHHHEHHGPPPPGPGHHGMTNQERDNVRRQAREARSQARETMRQVKEQCKQAKRAEKEARRGRGGPSGPGPFPGGFNLAAFLQNLSERLGVDLGAAAQQMGFDVSHIFPGANAQGSSDFVPSHDLFDLESEYLVHVSLPGAAREDIGLDYDAENNKLRVAGVVYRPNVTEEMSAALVQGGRSTEIGPFETKIKLPTSNDTNTIVEINANAITAKLRDGILVIHIPKIVKNKSDLKRSIYISTPSASPSPERGTIRPEEVIASPLAHREKNADRNAKELDMYNSRTVSPVATDRGDLHHKEQEDSIMNVDETVHEDPPEQLPEYSVADLENEKPHHDNKGKEKEQIADAKAYQVDSDTEEEEEEEGEYVKINVD